MADRYLLESGSPDGYLLEDGSGVLLLNNEPSTWSTTDKHASVTLSNGNLTITGAAFNSQHSARTSGVKQPAGSLSLSISTFQASSQVAFGLCDLTSDFSQFGTKPGFTDSNGICVEIAQTGAVNLFRNATAGQVTASGSHTSGDSYRLSWDDSTDTVTLYRTRTGSESQIATANWAPDAFSWGWGGVKNDDVITGDFSLFTAAASSDVTLALTGQSLTAARGSVTGASDLAITGQSLTAARGTVVQGSVVTGQATTAAQGSAAASTTVALTGQSVATAVGSVLAQTAAGISGQAAVATQGSVAPAASAAITGAASTAAAGTVTVLVTDVTLALTGQALATADGSVAPEISAAITGQALSGAQGAILGALSAAISGQALAAARGSATPEFDKTISGHELTVAQGSVAAETNVTASGVSVATTQGSALGETSLAIAGLATSAVQDAVIGGVTAALIGTTGTLSQGSVTAPGDVTVALTGQALAVSRGTVVAGSIDQPVQKLGGGTTFKNAVAPGAILRLELHLQPGSAAGIETEPAKQLSPIQRAISRGAFTIKSGIAGGRMGLGDDEQFLLLMAA